MKSKLLTMQELQDAVGHGYTKWLYGDVTPQKMAQLRKLFHELYSTGDSKDQRYRRKRYGFATAQIVEYPVGDKIAFFLLATEGKGLIQGHRTRTS